MLLRLQGQMAQMQLELSRSSAKKPIPKRFQVAAGRYDKCLGGQPRPMLPLMWPWPLNFCADKFPDVDLSHVQF